MIPIPVDAIQFDGTAAGVEEVVSWGRTVAPQWPIRPRTEYSGWNDATGHLELEVMGMDSGCMAGDWILVTVAEERQRVWIVDEATFAKYYEEIQD